jgi:hypothetical protein
MARIKVDDSALASVGQLIADAVRDPQARTAFKADPSSHLQDAGVQAADMQGIGVKIIEDQENTVNIVLPWGVDNAKIDANDQEYLRLLGTVALLSCTR